MIIKETGDLIKSVTKGHIVHGCNAKGVMGSGFAKQIKETYPKAYDKYLEKYNSGKMYLGQLISVKVSDDLWIHNAITQNNYGNDGQIYVDYEAIDTVFFKLEILLPHEDDDLHFPMIGAGLGGGNWNKIEEIIEKRVLLCRKHLWTLPN
jgi:O-acetyl-ADP-ribose deacetylase (regulator of RNase III)